MTELPAQQTMNTRTVRRGRTAAEKRRMVEETLEPGTSVSIVARRHDVNANQLFTWRRQYRKGELTERRRQAPALISVGVIKDSSSATISTPPTPKLIEIILESGIKVRIDGEVRLPVLERVLKMVRGLA